MDKLSVADILQELESLFSLHSADAFPTLALLYAGLQQQVAQSKHNTGEGCLRQVCEVVI